MVESPNQEIKKQEAIIDKAVSDKNMQETESVAVKDAKDSLKKIQTDEKTDKKRQDKAREILDNPDKKTQVKDAIIKYFPITLVPKAKDPSTSESKVELSKNLTIEQIDAYINVLTRAQEKNANTSDQDRKILAITNALNAEKLAIPGRKDAAEKATDKNKLDQFFGLNKIEKADADKLFSGDPQYKDARDALFDANNVDQTIQREPKESDNTNKPNNKKIIEIIAKYLEITDENKIKKITFKKGGADQEFNENSIKVDLGGDAFKDILFTKTTDQNYQKRSENYNVEDRAKDTKDLQTKIGNLDTKGSYWSFKKVLESSKVEDVKTMLSDGQLLAKIKEGNKGRDDINTKENGYYTVIADYVVAQTEKGMIQTPADLALMQAYLKNVNRNNVKYLGADDATQRGNYNKLYDLVQKPTFPKDDERGKEIKATVQELYDQLKPTPKGVKEALKDGVTGFFKAFGSFMPTILNFLGGKDKVQKFFENLGLGKFYKDNLQSIQDGIDKAYKEKYELSKDQKDAVTSIIGGKGSEKFGNDPVPETTDPAKKISTAIDKFRSNTNKSGGTNEEVFAKDLKEKFKFMDPALVKYLANKDFSDSKTLKGTDEEKKQLTESDFVTKGSDGKLTINENISKEDQNKIINRLFADKTTRESIKSANSVIEGVKTSGPTAKVETFSRSDLGTTEAGKKENREQYAIQTEQDIARYLAAYAFAGSKDLDYVITENDMSHEVKETVTAKTYQVADGRTPTFRKENNGDENYGDLKAGDKVVAVLEKGEEVMKTGTELKITKEKNPTLTADEIAGKNWLKVKMGDNTGYIWKGSLEEVKTATTTPEATAETKETPDKKREAIAKDFNEATSTDKDAFNKEGYALNDNNTYEKPIKSLSNLFTSETDFKALATETDLKTLEAMVPSNMENIKNMLTFRDLQKGNAPYKDVLSSTIGKDQLSKIDVTKSDFTITATEKDGIKITVVPKDAADKTSASGTINLSQENKKTKASWTETPAATAATNPVATAKQ